MRRPTSVRATRRHALFGGLCLCCLPALGRSAETFALQEVGPGIFVRQGPHAEASRENDDAIANIGFIVGRDAVCVTESGGSRADGDWLRAEIRKRTAKPIRYVVLSHVHPDHVFGASAFLPDQPAFIGHHALRGLLDARGEFYRKRLVEILGEDRTGSIVYPTMEVRDRAEIDLGERRLHVRAHASAHSPSDLSMLDEASGILFPADLLFVGRVPSLDGNLLGWFKEIDTLKAVGAAKAVPGHGPSLVDFAPAIDRMSLYLTALRDGTRKAIAAGVPIEKATREVAQSERSDWALFDEYNARNVTQAYQQLEWE